MKLSVKLSVLSKYNHIKLKQRSIISTLLIGLFTINSPITDDKALKVETN